jgi:hypothetical protein
LQFLKLYFFCLSMLFALRFHDLSLYKTIFHRKWFRFKCVSYIYYIIKTTNIVWLRFCGLLRVVKIHVRS